MSALVMPCDFISMACSTILYVSLGFHMGRFLLQGGSPHAVTNLQALSLALEIVLAHQAGVLLS